MHKERNKVTVCVLPKATEREYELPTRVREKERDKVFISIALRTEFSFRLLCLGMVAGKMFWSPISRKENHVILQHFEKEID